MRCVNSEQKSNVSQTIYRKYFNIFSRCENLKSYELQKRFTEICCHTKDIVKVKIVLVPK
jgi:hypothetical protein